MSQQEIWFLTGSQNLYGPETLQQVAQQSQVVVDQLATGITAPVKLVWKPTLKSNEEIRQALSDASADKNCIGVITWMHTFSPAKMWINGLDLLRKPLLHLHTQAGQSLPWSTIDMDFMNLNQAAHGDREYAHILTRMSIARKIVVGHPTQSDVKSAVDAWSYAAIGLHTSQHLKLARFGDNMRYVAVTDGDKVSAQIDLGISVENLGVNTLVEAVDKVSDSQAEALAAEYEKLYDVVPELRAGGARHDSLVYAAKQEIALRAILEQGGYKAFTSNFEDLGTLKQLPGLAVQRLMADGYGFAGEGDWKTSALVAILKSMAPSGQGVSFMEDYTYHFGPGTPKVLGAHMLEVCPTITTAKPKIEIHPLGIGGKEDPVRMVFTATPARGRVLCWVDLGERFRIISNEVEVVEPTEDLPKLPVARAVWEPAPSLAVSAEAWMLAGGSHHTALTTTVSSETIDDFARMLGVEHVAIDQSTTSKSIRQELAWSSAYHRLAARL
ncbi:L-arabinose isomerase [Aquiluna sp. KACHI24]|uniref:L-arabinose isomerase n=1 Tax=Aquiluna sp. KACHI24 TaxID=2968831 RepID=UPI00220669DF|nr:L-arabinose isomerase [Aquiluna sp. KACHI24]BDQ00986.1 L-arabinose isomerase [Aquiluna sp. KACHI24]